jgi:hypothetical protein
MFNNLCQEDPADNGFAHFQYLNPKDPRKKGPWSDIVTVQPVQLWIVDPNVPHLATKRKVEYLCCLRVLTEYVLALECTRQLYKIRPGEFWTALGSKMNGAGIDLDKMQHKLEPTTLSKIVVTLSEKGGITVKSDEEAGDSPGKLGGHYLRGHSGSVAYTLACCPGGACWDASLGIDRARHTLASFKKYYSRGVCPRMLQIFLRHPLRSRMFFETALLL